MAERIPTETDEETPTDRAPPSPDLAAFLARLADAVGSDVGERELVALVLSAENPLVRADPRWSLVLDLLGPKRDAWLRVADAAAELDLTHDAVLKAIRAGLLVAQKRGGGWWVDPASIATYRDRVVRRGRHRAPEGPALVVRCGNREGASLSVKARETVKTGKSGRYGVELEVPSFERAAVSISGREGERKFRRMLVLEPSEDEYTFEFAPFFVRGRARVAREVEGLAAAAKAWREFEPE